MLLMRIDVIFALVALTVFKAELTDSRTSSSLWRLNLENGKITTARRDDMQLQFHHGRLRDNTDNIRRNAYQQQNQLYGMKDEDSDNNNNNYNNDELFRIITSTMHEGNGVGWIRQPPEPEQYDDYNSSTNKSNQHGGYEREDRKALLNEKNNGGGGGGDNKAVSGFAPTTAASPATPAGNMMEKNTDPIVSLDEETLDCGKPVNFTYYDYLIGVGHRFNHPLVPEPEVAYLFLKTKDERSYKNFDITALERRLKKAKRERPRSVHLYNQIGNYWRIVGDAQQAIECFRRALAMSPTNAEVLLNLARVLYNLQYLDDAIHLTRRSLEMQPPGRSAWQQYFTLGEIFKAYGHFQESIFHLRQALELYPHHKPILKALRDVENNPSSTLHVYTIVIIVALVIAVFIVIITSSTSTSLGNGNKCNTIGGFWNGGGNISQGGQGHHGGSHSSGENETRTHQRHFNRAMAMRSLKGLSSSSASSSASSSMPRHNRHRRN